MSKEHPTTNLDILRSNQEAIPQIIDRKRNLVGTYQKNVSDLAKQLEAAQQAAGVTPGLNELITIGLQRMIDGRQNGIRIIAASIQHLEAELAETALAADLGDRGYIRTEINALQTKIKRRRLPEKSQPLQQPTEQETQPTITERIEQVLFDQCIIEQRSLKVQGSKKSPVMTLLRELVKEPKTPEQLDTEVFVNHKKMSTRGRKVITPLKHKLVPIGLNIHATYDQTGHVLQYRIGVLPTNEEAIALSEHLKAQEQQLRESVASANTYEEAIEIVYKSLNANNEQLAKCILLVAGWWGKYAYRSKYLGENSTPPHIPDEIGRAVYQLGSIINPVKQREVGTNEIWQ